jgi:Ca-activated chloride channel family protein
MRKPLQIAMVLAVLCSPARAASGDRIAMRLFNEGRFAEAAELFTEPAWKGIAFYRSEQHWRAIEAFLRAGDAASTFNLGNAYVQLGYLELALQAYLQVLSVNPDDQDAAANADLVRQALAARDRNGQGGIRPKAEAVDQLETEKEKQNGPSGEGEQGKAEERRSDGENLGATETADRAETTGNQGGGGGSEGAQKKSPATDDNDASAKGHASDEETGGPSGGASASNDVQDGSAVGRRAELEAQQATAQWLNGIVDDPGRFLKARIDLEARRRAAAGIEVKSAEDEW